MRTVCTFLCLSLVFLLPSQAIKAQVTNNLPATSSTAPNWTNSVVAIWYECNGKTFSGTGVIVSKSGYILTAAHVGRNCNNVAGTKIKVGIGNSVYAIPQKTFTASVINSITDNVGNPNVYDLKLLKIDSTNGVQLHPATFSTVLPFPGDDVSIAGFPDLPFEYLSQKQSSLSVFKTNVLSCFDEGNNNIVTRLHYGGNSLPGFSGGPIFDKSGHLIGIHSSRTTANINNLLNTNCNETTANPCYGNAVRFPVLTANNTVVSQVVNLDYNALKTVLDNYSWGTSIWRVPQQWITLIQQ